MMKCYNCGGQLTSPSGITLRICPFCDFDSDTKLNNTQLKPEDVLRNQIMLNGREFFESTNDLSKIIDELFINDLELCKSLNLAIKLGISKRLLEILYSDLETQKRSITLLSHYFADEYGYEFYRAKEIIRIFALALGITSEALENRIVNTANSSNRYPIVKNKKGNTTGNIVNYGLVTQQGEWIYYIDNSDGSRGDNYRNKHKLYKVRIDGSGCEKLSDDYCRYINVIGEWVYYCHSNGRLHKLRVDGSSKTELGEIVCSYVTVIDDWIYFCNERDGNRIYKAKTDGSNIQRINDDESFDINVDDDWIYYSNRNDGYSIYKIRLDGTERTKLNDDDSAFINVVDDWIYYIKDENRKGRFRDNQSSKVLDEWAVTINNPDVNKAGKICKLKTDGTEIVKIYDGECTSINVSNGWIYFVKSLFDSSVNLGLSKISINNLKIVDIEARGSCVNIVNDWIYYYTPNTRQFGNSNLDFIKVRTDGTERQSP